MKSKIYETILKESGKILSDKKNVVQELGIVNRVILVAILSELVLNYFNECKRKCGLVLIGEKRHLCYEACKINSYKRALDYATQQKSSCRTAPNPKKCLKSIDSAIDKIKAKIKKHQQKYDEIRFSGAD